MMDVTVKTLDGLNRSFSVPENITVKQFKEKIANSINIPANTQRLIFQGRVLHDEKLLKDYDVHGKVVHVVVRAPPSANRPADSRSSPRASSVPGGRDVNSIMVGSFTMPSDRLDDMVQNIAQDAVQGLGNNVRVSTRSSNDGSAVDVHIHLGPIHTGQATSEAQMRLNTARQMIRLANEALSQLENPASAGSSAGTPRSSTPTPSRTAPATSSPDSPMDTSEVEDETVDTSQATADSTSSEAVSQSGQRTDSAGPSQSEPDSSTPASETADQQSSGQSAENTARNGQPGAQGPVRPNISALGEVLTEVSEINERLQPYIERFSNIVQADAEMDQTEQRDAQRVCNLVSEAMHAVSHAYHAVSDLMVDLNQARPRQLFVTLAIAQPHTTVIHQTVPVQAQIQIGGSPRLIRRQFTAPGGANTRPASSQTSATTTSTVSSSASSSTSSSATASVGTSAHPTTTETGTQPTATGTQPGAQPHGLSAEDLDRVASGIQSVLGEGLQQGDGSPENPYVYVEMGPDSMTVNSISAQVVTTTEPSSTETTPNTSTSGATSTSQTQSGPQPAGPQAAPANPPEGQQAGAGVLPPEVLQTVVQQIQQLVQQAGPGGPAQRMHINVGPGHAHGAPMFPPRMPMGIRLGPTMMRAGVPGPFSQTGTQTSTAGVPSNSGTQTNATTTSASSTQTSGGVPRTSPSSTSGTQTPGIPRAAAFVLPGQPGMMGMPAGIPGMPAGIPGMPAGIPGMPAGIPGMPAGIPGMPRMPGMPGLGGQQGGNPVDPYLQCMSRHFLTRHARDVINQTAQPTNDGRLADMVGNLVSGLLGATAGGPGEAAPATSSTSASSTTSSTSTTSTSRTGPRPATQTSGPRANIPTAPGLQHLFPGRMPFIPGMSLRFGMPAFAGMRPTAAPAEPSSRTGPSPAAPTSTTAGSQPAPSGTEPQFVQMLRSMLQSASGGGGQAANSTTPSSSTSSTPSGTTPAQGAQGSGSTSQPFSDEAFTQLVTNITGYMTQAAMGQAPRQTISDFLTGLGETYSIPQGEGFINDMMSCVLSHLQITDLIQVFYGQSQALNQVQGPLREFINTRVLEDAPPTQENIRAAVARLVESMQPEIQETVDATEPRAGIDFLATLNFFLNQQFANVVTLIMNYREGDSQFGADFFACMHRLISELLMLCSRCLGGIEAVERLVSHRLRNLTADVNPIIQDWMVGMTTRQLSTFIPAIAITEAQVSFYVINKSPDQPSTPRQTAAEKKPAKPSAASSPAASGARKDRDPSPRRQPPVVPARKLPTTVAAAKSQSLPMETSPPMSSPGASEMEVDCQKPSPSGVKAAAASATPAIRTTPDTDNQPSPSGAQSVNGGDTWQTVVPPDWVPVITRDMETQKKEPAQQPYSDVYLQGLPPKRRRLMTQDRPGNIGNTQQVLPDSIRRAVAAAAVEPISNLDNLTHEITTDTDLHDSFNDQVASSLSRRINADRDYSADRFPNSEDYYHKANDKKK